MMRNGMLVVEYDAVMKLTAFAFPVCAAKNHRRRERTAHQSRQFAVGCIGLTMCGSK